MAVEKQKTISGANKKKETGTGHRKESGRGRSKANCALNECEDEKREKVSWAEEAILDGVRFIMPSCPRLIMFRGGPYNKVWRSIASIYWGTAHLIIWCSAAHRRSCDTHLGLWRRTEWWNVHRRPGQCSDFQQLWHKPPRLPCLTSFISSTSTHAQ